MIKNTYSLDLTSGLVFKVEDFINMLRFKNYWDNSYTKYTNEIGLTSENKYFKYNSDAVLDFPHKDSILEGGMTKEEVGKKEIYYHNIIAKEEVSVYQHENYEIESISMRDFDKRKEEIQSQYVEQFQNIFRNTSVQKENEFQNKILNLCEEGLYTADYKVSRGKNKSKWITAY